MLCVLCFLHVLFPLIYASNFTHVVYILYTEFLLFQVGSFIIFKLLLLTCNHFVHCQWTSSYSNPCWWSQLIFDETVTQLRENILDYVKRTNLQQFKNYHGESVKKFTVWLTLAVFWWQFCMWCLLYDCTSSFGNHKHLQLKYRKPSAYVVFLRRYTCIEKYFSF